MYVDLIPMITYIRFVFTACIWCFFHAFSCITATSIGPQAALGFSGVVSGGDAAASASKDSTLKAWKCWETFQSLKYLQIWNTNQVQTLSFSLTWLATGHSGRIPSCPNCISHTRVCQILPELSLEPQVWWTNRSKLKEMETQWNIAQTISNGKLI